MKIDILNIIKIHFLIVIDADSYLYKFLDLSVFYLIPISLSILAYYFHINVKNETLELCVSVFAIFSALLLSVQIALFSIFQRDWDKADHVKDHAIEILRKKRSELLKELNANISYLNIICCVFISILVLFFIFDINNQIESAIFILFSSHFALTILMVIKRAHALFQKEYEMF